MNDFLCSAFPHRYQYVCDDDGDVYDGFCCDDCGALLQNFRNGQLFGDDDVNGRDGVHGDACSLSRNFSG